MRTYRGDPRWITARFAGACGKCNGRIATGERIFYYPSGRAAYCEKCGEPMANEFTAYAMDEENNRCL